MNMFNKLDMYMDYNNHYSINKALNTLQREFNLAISKQNGAHAKETLYTLNRVYEKLSGAFKESEDLSETMSFSQKIMAKKMRGLQSIFITRMKNELYVTTPEDIVNVHQ